MYGLGTEYKTDPNTGTVIDCDDWSNIFQGVCWNPTAPVVTLAPGSSTTTAADGTTTLTAATAAATESIFGLSTTMLFAVLGGAVLLIMLMKK